MEEPAVSRDLNPIVLVAGVAFLVCAAALGILSEPRLLGALLRGVNAILGIFR